MVDVDSRYGRCRYCRYVIKLLHSPPPPPAPAQWWGGRVQMVTTAGDRYPCGRGLVPGCCSGYMCRGVGTTCTRHPAPILMLLISWPSKTWRDDSSECTGPTSAWAFTSVICVHISPISDDTCPQPPSWWWHVSPAPPSQPWNLNIIIGQWANVSGRHRSSLLRAVIIIGWVPVSPSYSSSPP